MSLTNKEKNLLRKVRNAKTPQESEPLTPTFSPEFLMKYDLIDDMDRTENEAKVGQTYCKKVRTSKEVRGFWGNIEKVEMLGYKVWQVIQPSTNVVERNENFVPKILENGKWIPAIPTQRMSWGTIPEYQKRVDYLLGELSDDLGTKQEDEYKENFQAGKELTEAIIASRNIVRRDEGYPYEYRVLGFAEPEPKPKILTGPYHVIMKIHGIEMSREYFTDKEHADAEAERLRTKYIYDNAAAAEARAKDIQTDPEDFVEIELHKTVT